MQRQYDERDYKAAAACHCADSTPRVGGPERSGTRSALAIDTSPGEALNAV
jgi:hypothetical protein